MAVLGRVLLSSAERIDLPDLLSIDSYVAGDFKFLLKGLVGDNKPFILKGFDVIDPSTSIGSQSCSIRTADSVVFYPGSKSGSFFHGLEEGHEQSQPLVPELRKNATNFVYLTFSTFNTSVDTRAFWDPDKSGGAGGEFTQDVDTQSVLKVDVNVSTGSFPANTIPIAKIVVGPVNIESITDCRDMMFRLGSGGISPDPFYNHQFRSLPSSSYKRTEPSVKMQSGGDNAFQGGDKNLYSLKEWMDLVMTKFKELSGTTYWYEDLSSYSLISGFVDACATTFKSKGKWQHSSATPGQVTWTQDLQIKTTQDPRTTIIRSGSKTLADEQVAYLNLLRNKPINATDSAVDWVNNQAYVNTVGGATGSFSNLAKGDWIKKANDPNHLFLRVEEFYDTVNLGGSITIPALARSIRLSSAYQGTTIIEKARYDKGVYAASDVIVSARSESLLTAAGGNFHWLAVRSDVIQKTSNISTISVIGTLSDADGAIVKATATSHGLIDGDRVTITAPVAQAGTYVVEVEDADTFYIKSSNTTVGALTGFYALATTAQRDNGYGLVLESAAHEFETGDTVAITSTTNYNGTYTVSKRNATEFQFAVNATSATESTGVATLARVNVRAEQGLLKIIQGENVSIGDGTADNISDFIGMNSMSETYPLYTTPSSYSAIDGMSSYGSSVTDSLTARASKLTAMMADKAQDKTIKYLPSSTLTTITNTTNGAAQEITFNSGSTLTIITPGTSGNATITLPSTSPGISLIANQSAYVSINRNSTSSPSIIVVDTDKVPIAENVFVIASRLTGADVYLWDSSIVNAGAIPAPGFLDDVVRQNQMLKLVEGGTWSWTIGTETLTWNAIAYIQIPGLANSANSIAASSVTLTSGQVAYVDINRTGSGGALTVNVAANSSLTLSTDRIIIARRDGSDVVVGSHSMRLITGESKKLYAGASDQLLTFVGASNSADSQPDYNGALAHTLRYITENSALETAISSLDDQLDKLFGQVRLRQASTPSKRVIVTGSDRLILDGSTLSQQKSNLLLDFTGAQIDFETGSVYASDGMTSLGVDFTPAAIALNQYRWYSITLIPSTVQSDNRIGGQLLILPADTDGTTVALAPRAYFGSGIKLGQVVVKNSGTLGVIDTITQTSITQLGVGSGGGDDVPMPLKLSVTGTSRQVSIGSIYVSIPADKNYTIPTIAGVLPNFTGGTITVPSTPGAITVSAGIGTSFSMSANQYVKIGINLDGYGNLLLSAGNAANTLLSATMPLNIPNTFNIGHIVIRTDGSGNVANILTSDVYQNIGDGESYDDVSSLYEENVDVVSSPSGNNQMYPISPAGDVIVLPRDTKKILGSNIVASTDGTSDTITVYKINHGLNSGDEVTINTSSDLGGIPFGNLSQSNASVSVIDVNTFTYEAIHPSSSVATGYLDVITANTIKYYVVGSGSLEIFLNGVKMRLGSDYTEESIPPGSLSNLVFWNTETVEGDVLTFRINAPTNQQIINGITGGSGETNTASNLGAGAQLYKQKVGVDLQFRSIEQGSGIAVTQTTNTIKIETRLSTAVKSSNYTATTSDDVILVDASGAPVSITLPVASSAVGKTLFIKKIDSSANAMTIQPNGLEVIDNASNKSTAIPYESLTIVSDSTKWWIL
jgi:hypothetical protein